MPTYPRNCLYVRRFARNERGRDFAVGDVHGNFDLLADRLRERRFDPGRDRVFSVGDLSDRGPASEDAMDWLDRPWFHAVCGNHERMAVGVVSGHHDINNFVANGGAWFANLPGPRQRVIASVFSLLPLAIEIEHPVGRVGVVHADVESGSWATFVSDIERAGRGETSGTFTHHLISSTTWSRGRLDTNDCSGVTDVGYLVVGHTAQSEPVRLDNVAFIDTGAYRTGNLTVIDLADLPSIPQRDGAVR